MTELANGTVITIYYSRFGWSKDIIYLDSYDEGNKRRHIFHLELPTDFCIVKQEKTSLETKYIIEHLETGQIGFLGKDYILDGIHSGQIKIKEAVQLELF